jgi:hypothetical protein
MPIRANHYWSNKAVSAHVCSAEWLINQFWRFHFENLNISVYTTRFFILQSQNFVLLFLRKKIKIEKFSISKNKIILCWILQGTLLWYVMECGRFRAIVLLSILKFWLAQHPLHRHFTFIVKIMKTTMLWNVVGTSHLCPFFCLFGNFGLP